MVRPRKTNEGRKMSETDDPDFCPDSPGPRKSHSFQTDDIDYNDNPVNICGWCGVQED